MAKGIRAARLKTGPQGGAFRLEAATVGVFLRDQPDHRIGLGSDRTAAVPLSARQGWIMPSGAEGLCTFGQDHEFLAVTIPPALLAEMGGTTDFTPVIGALDPVVVELALQSEGFAARGTLYRETMERALVAQVTGVVQPGAGPQLDDRRLQRAVDRIMGHLGEDLSLDILAGEAGMSPFHFSRAFKAATGASPLQYVIRARIEAAQAMLKGSRLAVAEIAHRVGYDDLSRFGQHFKRQVGTTPGAWRAE
jgi:AraC family transcriptional regulator